MSRTVALCRGNYSLLLHHPSALHVSLLCPLHVLPYLIRTSLGVFFSISQGQALEDPALPVPGGSSVLSAAQTLGTRAGRLRTLLFVLFIVISPPVMFDLQLSGHPLYGEFLSHALRISHPVPWGELFQNTQAWSLFLSSGTVLLPISVAF